MNDIVVIYESKYGCTRKYAKWISEDLNADLYEKKDFDLNNLNNYKTVVYGGGLYAGGVSGASLISKNFDKLENKNVILFTCGLADPNDESNVEGICSGLSKIFTPEMKESMTIFHLRGGIDYSKLNFVHKTMMAMLKKMLSKKDYDSLRNEDKEMLATYGGVVDFTDKSTIIPLVDYVKNIV